MEPETIEDVLALLSDHPDDVELYQRLGGLYFKERDLMRAWQVYMQALKLDPDDPFTCLYFGTLLSICDDKKYAMLLFEHAVEVAPKLAVAHWCKANLHRELSEFDLANREFEKAVAVDPDDEQALAKLAEWREFITKNRGF